jgi:hypothetical protein
MSLRTKNRRATQCVQREYSWLLAALAELRLAHSRQRHAPLLSITRRHRVTATGMGTVGHGMDAHPVTRYRAETAHPTKDQLAAVGVAVTAARPVTQSKAVFVSRTGVQLVPARDTITVECLETASKCWRPLSFNAPNPPRPRASPLALSLGRKVISKWIALAAFAMAL